MKLPLLLPIITATLLSSPTMVAEEHLGPAVYLAAVHDVDGKSVLHWKYNIAKPEFVEVKVLDGKKQDIALIKRPVRRVDVTGRSGPFSLFPMRADGTHAEPVGVPFVSAVQSAEGNDTAVVPALPASRIGITHKGGKAQFVHLATGTIFNPVGMNYVPLRGDHAAFDAATRTTEAFYDGLRRRPFCACSAATVTIRSAFFSPGGVW